MKSIALFKEYITADFQRYEPRPFFPYFFLRMTVYHCVICANLIVAVDIPPYRLKSFIVNQIG